MTGPVEHEMKLPVSSLTQVRERLPLVGGRLTAPLADEENWVLDDAAGTLCRDGLLLRLRRSAGRSRLTFKGIAHFRAGVKSREETECVVDDGSAVLAILARIGFEPVRRYQKRREEWSFGDVSVALDETPMGAFVEIEGAPERLVATAVELGLDPACAVRGSYLDLWEAHRVTHPEAPKDMVFG